MKINAELMQKALSKTAMVTLPIAEYYELLLKATISASYAEDDNKLCEVTSYTGYQQEVYLKFNKYTVPSNAEELTRRIMLNIIADDDLFEAAAKNGYVGIDWSDRDFTRWMYTDNDNCFKFKGLEWDMAIAEYNARLTVEEAIAEEVQHETE